jgi:hypothetical protein
MFKVIRIAWIINLAVILLATVNCDAFVKGWIWDEYLPGYHCKGLPVSQDSFNHLGIPWEHYVVEKSDWLIEDFPGFEICLPQQGMRIFRCFTFRGRKPPSHSNTDKDNDISFFVMGLDDGCSLEELYSSGTLCIWSSRQFKYDHGTPANKEYLEKLVLEYYAHSNCDVCLECWPHPSVEASLSVNTDEMAFKLFVLKNGTVYQVSTFMPIIEHRDFFLKSFQLR